MSASVLAIILGDQLDRRTPAALGLDKNADRILMAEVRQESVRPASHIQRTAMFFSAMRHAAADFEAAGWNVEYRDISQTADTGSLGDELARAIRTHKPARVACLQPGDRRTLDELDAECDDAGIELVVTEDPHFLCPIPVFADWVSGRKEIILEYFYRQERK